MLFQRLVNKTGSEIGWNSPQEQLRGNAHDIGVCLTDT